MANFFIGLFLVLVLLFFWSRTFWYIVGWLLGMSLWVSGFGYALSLMFSDQSATPYIWGTILGIPLYCVVSTFCLMFWDSASSGESYESDFPLHLPQPRGESSIQLPIKR